MPPDVPTPSKQPPPEPDWVIAFLKERSEPGRASQRLLTAGEKQANSGLRAMERCHQLLSILPEAERQSGQELLLRYARTEDPVEKILLRNSLNELVAGATVSSCRTAHPLENIKLIAPAKTPAFFMSSKSAIQCHGHRRFEPPASLRLETSERPVESEVARPKEAPPARLWGRNANPFDSIQPQAVVQGSLDNCYLLSALASLARTRPELLKEMISQNADGQSFTVCFPGARDRPVTIDAPSQKELEKITKSTEFGSWPAILEKALGKYLKENNGESLRLLGHELANSSAADPAQHTDGGGKASMMLKLLTGTSTSGVEIHRRRDPEPSHDLLKLAFHTNDQRLPVVAVISESNVNALKAGLTPRHAYSVLAYDPDTRILTLRDPYGKAMQNSEGLAIETNEGVFRMRLDHFIHLFDELSCAGNSSSGTRGFMIMPRQFRTNKQVK